jgi:hypothetical protein
MMDIEHGIRRITHVKENEKHDNRQNKTSAKEDLKIPAGF